MLLSSRSKGRNEETPVVNSVGHDLEDTPNDGVEVAPDRDAGEYVPGTFVRLSEGEGESNSMKDKSKAKKNHENLSAAEKSKLGLGQLTPDELLGRSVLFPEAQDGTRYRAQIVQKIVEHDEKLNKEIIKFKVKVPGFDIERIRDYHDLLEEVESQTFQADSGEIYHNVLEICGHQSAPAGIYSFLGKMVLSLGNHLM